MLGIYSLKLIEGQINIIRFKFKILVSILYTNKQYCSEWSELRNDTLVRFHRSETIYK